MATPLRLGQVLTDIARLYTTLKERRDKKSVKEFRDRVIDLRNIINDDILRSLNIVNSGDVNQWDAMDDVWKLARLKALDEKVALEESVELSDFFFNVSNAVITAQTNLNEFSKRYVEQIKDPRVPPTYFAIPSVKAEMKLGFNELTEKGVNIVLFKSTAQESRFLESTVTFELVSTPPLTTSPPPTPRPSPPTLPPTPPEPSTLPLHPRPPLVTPRPSTLLELTALPDFGRDASSGSPLEDVAEDQPREEDVNERDESETENLPELRQSLEDARASFFAATDRLIESRALFESRAQRALTQETPVVVGDEREEILKAITNELEAEGEKLGENFAERRAQAVVLKYHSTGAEEDDRFLVIWPGGSVGDKADAGRELRVYVVTTRRGRLKLDDGAFRSAPENKFLAVVPKKQLLRLKKNEMADLAGALGDALMLVSTILNEWLEASRRG